MTTANKITIFRVLLIPIMLIFIYIPSLKEPIGFGSWDISIGQFIFAIIFIFASLTDFLDGFIARKYNQITTFGKFLDPLADKILVLTGFLYLLSIDPIRFPVWAIMLVIIREFTVTGIRLLAVEKKNVIAASFFGKIKTLITMVTLVWLLFNDFGLSTQLLGNILFYTTIVITVLSGLEYLIKNRRVVLESM